MDFIVRMLKFSFICLILSSTVYAQNFLEMEFSSQANIPAIQPVLQLELDQVSYSSESPYDRQNQQSAELTLGHNQKGFVFSKSEFVLGATSERQSFYAAAPEIFVGLGDQARSFVATGRLKKNYSFVDSYYNLGLYNSYFTNDFIGYKEQGLTGIHAQAYNGIVGGFVGWHPLYLPNQEPQVQEENGNLVSSNRWAQRPPAQYQFADQNHPIEYVIRDYRLSEIVENQGHTASVFVGDDPQRPWLQLSYANHPVNEIPLTRDTYGSASDSVGHVHLSPVVTYHEVKSTDINFDFLNIQTSLSYVEDRVQNKVAAENEALQNLSPLQIYGVYIAANVGPWVQRQLILSIAAAEMKGGEIKDFDQNGKESIFSFSNRRMQFKAPVTLGLSTELLFIRSKPLKTQVRWTYDRTDKGSLVSAQAAYEVIPKMNIHMGADIVGVENTLPEDAPSNFLDRNQANDRIYGGLQYAF